MSATALQACGDAGFEHDFEDPDVDGGTELPEPLIGDVEPHMLMGEIAVEEPAVMGRVAHPTMGKVAPPEND